MQIQFLQIYQSTYYTSVDPLHKVIMWILDSIVLICIILYLVYIIADRRGSPKTKGKIGELKVKLTLGRGKAGKKRIVNNIIVEEDGKTSQIDHVVITGRGIFCIETKNYAGRIYGSEDQQHWTQVLAYGKTKNQFYNPLKQNWTHAMRLSHMLEDEYPVYSIVVFTHNNTRYISARDVVDLKGLKKLLSEKGEANALTPEQIETVANRLLFIKDVKMVTEEDHMDEINKTKMDLANNICPRCGGNLILRRGKYGSFYGCSNYPKCRFIKKISS
ncbi:MAG: NERD domain-containing protein [Clostridia bacterium]|nr:NERD domain-containing protein [Clostridia bacterium]